MTFVITLEQSPAEVRAALEETRAAVSADAAEGAAHDQDTREAARRLQAASQVCHNALHPTPY